MGGKIMSEKMLVTQALDERDLLDEVLSDGKMIIFGRD